MLVDLFMTAPVTLFMMWLYWYSAPGGLPRWLRIIDTINLISAPLAVGLIIVVGHTRSDWPGMGLNVMLVAAAYLALVGLLGLGWLLRRAALSRNAGATGQN
ncbi:MAG: hypothetical protein LC637_00835 [Xanthomonadaceae bacterium]|nr:hypothetical protein [Xanthomonadaceae bacterium]